MLFLQKKVQFNHFFVLNDKIFFYGYYAAILQIQFVGVTIKVGF